MTKLKEFEKRIDELANVNVKLFNWLNKYDDKNIKLRKMIETIDDIYANFIDELEYMNANR